MGLGHVPELCCAILDPTLGSMHAGDDSIFFLQHFCIFLQLMCIFSKPAPFFSSFSCPPRFGARSLLRTHVRPFGLFKRSYQLAKPAQQPPPGPPGPHPAPPGPTPHPARRPTAPCPQSQPRPGPPGPPPHPRPDPWPPGPLGPVAVGSGRMGLLTSRVTCCGRRLEGGASAACSGMRAAATVALRRCGGV